MSREMLSLGMNELYEIVLEIERKPEGEECLKYHTT